MEEENKKEKYLLSTSWTQTLITMMIKEDAEDDAFKHKNSKSREIKSTSKISANIKDPFDIRKEDFIVELPLRVKHLINPRELEWAFTRDAENQTSLQSVRTVAIPTEYKHEASQTMYTSSPHPTGKYSRNIMTSMNVSPIPAFKNNCSSQNTITIAPRTLQHEAVRYLSQNIRTYEQHQENFLQDSIDKETIILEILNFLLSRAFWTSDLVLEWTPAETKCRETQTIIRYNHNTDSIVLDNETQTRLTCQPKYSNSKLLTEYEETKHFVQNCLWECLRGIESRIIIDEFIDEIIVKGAGRLKYPMKEQVIQTVASYKSSEMRDEDVLRKLRIPVIIDPFEASIVVVPLIDDLLRSTCDEISRNARHVVKNILDSSIRQTVVIGFNLAEIRKQSQPDSIEQILDRRRKKIVESMLEKETETAATQTGLAGVPEVVKLKEPKEVLCSVYGRQSICYWCAAAQDEDTLPENKKLRTQDILLAYNPCYVIATASEEAKNPHLQSINLTKKVEKLTTAQLATRCAIPKRTDIADKTIDVLMTPKRNIQVRDSMSGWARIMDNMLAKSWSLKDSASNTNSVTTISSAISRSSSKSCCKESSQSESVPSLQATHALQILKNTFCTRDTCTVTCPTMQERRLSDKSVNEKRMFCNLENCTLLNLDRHTQHINNIDGQICARPRIVPTRLLSKFRK